MQETLQPTQKPTQAPTVAAAKKKVGVANSRKNVLETIMALALILFIMICIGALCNRRQKEQRSNQRALEMSNRQSSYEPPIVEGERVPTPMGRVPASKLESRGAVV